MQIGFAIMVYELHSMLYKYDKPTRTFWGRFSFYFRVKFSIDFADILKTIIVFSIISKGIFIGPDHLATMEGSTVETFFELYINITC